MIRDGNAAGPTNLAELVWGRSKNELFISHAPTVSLDYERLPVHQPIDQGRGDGVVHVAGGTRFLEGSMRGKHDRAGVVAESNYLRQPVELAIVDGQIAQLIRGAICKKNEQNAELDYS